RNILGLFRGPLQVDGHDLYLSASIGLCFFPGDGEDIHQLIKNADAAMYKAKARGRNNYCRFEKAMETEIQARLLMDTELRGAAANSELLLHFQPVFDLMSREITGMEALLRWNNPHLGQVSPGVFIPLAEETGSIRELDLWTMESGIQQLARWREEGVFAGRLALNMSARQLENQDFIPRLSGLLQQHALRGSDISLELTETALMKNIAAMTPLLETMGDMGIELMIDDFGTGYSSLNYLKRLPVHVVKIDRSFVEEIGTEESDSIVRTIIAMARTLDLKVIAEGVETEEQFQFLRREGCDLVQGFYLARPADEAAIRSILLRGVAPSPSANGEA
ncbi:MAG: EAL domain-containing protein, partial [Leptospiraceae bacterium]|nr:EAL domain-containing protein [Leptospiraceae bacterium]